MAPVLSKDEVRYRQGTLEEHCGNCVMFTRASGSGGMVLVGHCDLVKGIIDAHAVCDRWEARTRQE